MKNNEIMRINAVILTLLLGTFIQVNADKEEDACRPEDGYHRLQGGKCRFRYHLYATEKENVTCNDEEFKCVRPIHKCVSRSKLNTIKGCSWEQNSERIVVPCRIDEFACARSGICLPRYLVRDGVDDCASKEVEDDRSDEEVPPYECSRQEFRCHDGGRCIPREWVLDDDDDCPYGSDEEAPLPYCNDEEEFQCKDSGRCLRRYRVKDGYNDCSVAGSEDGSDENTAALLCNSSTEFQCTDSGRCIPRMWMSDGTDNCEDGSDEEEQNSPECKDGEFRCLHSHRCILLKYLCDGMNHCGEEDCSDEIESCDEPRMWRCPGNGNHTCIPQSYGCDVYPDCQDGSDNPGYLPGFKCSVKIPGDAMNCAIPQWTLTDSHAICEGKEDICYVNGTFQCEKCGNAETIIGKPQICDGVVDCRDLWDECLCDKTWKNRSKIEQLCNNVCYGGKSPACQSCPSKGEVYCGIEDKCINRTELCDGKVDCPMSELDEKFCEATLTYDDENLNQDEDSFTCWPFSAEVIEFLKKKKLINVFEKFAPKTAKKCDGVIECARFEDECSSDCPNIPSDCGRFRLYSNYSTRYIPGITISIRVCSDFDPDDIFDFIDFVGGSSLCNGIQECKDGADEESCPGRHYCDAGEVVWILGARKIVSIEDSKLCDHKPDCSNSTDEMNCTKGTHFYCHNRLPLFVHVDTVTDGKQDCEDNSDECPPSEYDNDPFSSRFEMIKEKFLRVFLWIMAILAIGGNVIVILETYFLEIKSSKSSPSSPMSKCNRLLIINLALCDFLMGIVLLSIGVKSSLMSGNYCAEEKDWRISTICSTIGALTVISSETSVFTLVVLTFYRLYGIYRPFTSRHVKPKKAFYAVMVTWVISILFAITPLVPRLNQSMLTSALTSPSAYFNTTTVSWSDFQTFATRAFVLNNTKYSPGEFTTWEHTVKRMKNAFPDYMPAVKGYFGYYSSHGVCLPRLFTTKDSPLLHPLSLLVISVNFLSLMFIIVAYCMIYRKSTTRGNIAGSASTKANSSKSMQTKITILIATDLCCWFPVCITTFLGQFGVTISPVAYAFTAIILLPINSSMNPLIYSNGFELTRKLIMEKCRKGQYQVNQKNRQNTNEQIVKIQKTGNQMQEVNAI